MDGSRVVATEEGGCVRALVVETAGSGFGLCEGSCRRDFTAVRGGLGDLEGTERDGGRPTITEVSPAGPGTSCVGNVGPERYDLAKYFLLFFVL